MASNTKNIPKLRFKEFSGEWFIVTIGELLKIKSGFGFNADEYLDSENGISLLQIENVGYGNIIRGKNNKYLPLNYLNKYPELSLKSGDVVIALNRPVTNNQLKIAILSLEDEPSILYQRVGKLLVNNNMAEKYYLYYSFQKYVKQFVLSQAVGSDQPFISINALYKFFLPIPIPKEQQKIADFLSSVDQKIQHLKQKKQLLEQYKKGMMQKLFSQQIRFKDENGMDYPEWNHGVLGFLSDVRDGTHDSPKYVSRGYPLITSKNLTENGNLDLTNVDYISEDDYLKINQRSEVHVGDILFGMIGTIGNPVYLNQSGFAIKNVALIKEKIKLLNQYLIHYLKSELIMRQFYIINTGGTQKFIALGKIRELFIDLPCLKEQKKLADFLSSLDKKIECVNSQITQTEQFKKGLLQQLLV